MMWPGQLVRVALIAIFIAALCGCSPAGSSSEDETREAHFLVGRSRVNAMDYKGAIESFEKALEVNPHSASAHFELGMLLAEKEPDPAAAIYHYQQYLKLRPNAENASVIQQHIQVLKQDLAKNVLPPTVTPALQREFELLAEENRRLRDEVNKWHAYYASQSGTPIQQTPTAATPTVERADATPAPTQSPPSQSTASAARTYTVKAGDNPSAIARKYGIKLDVLMAANPDLKPTKMRIGQSINVPAP
jgi:tetratricopeptide (TPR) repeat protein